MTTCDTPPLYQAGLFFHGWSFAINKPLQLITLLRVRLLLDKVNLEPRKSLKSFSERLHVTLC